MNNQLKPGDLALLIKTLAHIGAGTVVELVDLIEKGEIVTNQDCTQINVAKARGWICKCPLGTLAVAEKNLMPLHGDFTTSPERAQEVPA